MATDKENVGDHADEVESVEEEEDQKELEKVYNFHDVITAFKNQQLAETMSALPPAVKRRINALKKIQLEATNIEAKFFKEVHQLECKYHNLYLPLYEKRQTIVTGAYEPTDEEAKFPTEEEEENELCKELKDKAVVDEKKPSEEEVPAKGVSEFWLTVFKNVSLLADMIQDHDEPILKHLIDIKTVLTEEPMVIQ